MGEPVNIKSLAEQMIRLSGLTIKDNSNPNGDIEIIITGLRPGEKLFEELLISDIAIHTLHELIYKGHEDFISLDKLSSQLYELEKFVQLQEEEKSLRLISKLLPEWNRYSANSH